MSPKCSPMPRTALIHRKTAETDIELELALDGAGNAEVATGVGFLDHMLTLLAKHAAIDLSVTAAGDLDVDQHHTVEDVGICLGPGDPRGPGRQGRHPPLRPFRAADGRDALHRGLGPRRPGRISSFRPISPRTKIGEFDTELVADFWQAFATNALCNLHINVHYGRNSHHIAEAIFKATARALRMAVEPDPRFPACPAPRARCERVGVPSPFGEG